MKNEIMNGARLLLTAPYQRNSGEGALIGAIFGVSQGDVANAVKGVFYISGVFDLAKAVGAVTEGAKMYWDNTAKNVTTTSSANTLIGCAVQAQQSGDATCRIRLGITA